MNILDIQDKLKNLSEQQLVQEMQMPSGSAPQFLVLSEITRRKRMRDDLMARQQAPQSTVAEEAVAAAGVPQTGLGTMAQAMAPQTDIAQNTGIRSLTPTAEPQRMAEGGLVGRVSALGGGEPPASFMRDPAVLEMAARMGVRPGQLWAQLSSEQRAMQEARMMRQEQPAPGLVTRDQYLDELTSQVGVNPSYDPVAVEQGTRPSFIMPSQEDLNLRYADESTPWVYPLGAPPSGMGAELQLPGTVSAPPPSGAVPQLNLGLAADTGGWTTPMSDVLAGPSTRYDAPGVSRYSAGRRPFPQLGQPAVNPDLVAPDITSEPVDLDLVAPTLEGRGLGQRFIDLLGATTTLSSPYSTPESTETAMGVIGAGPEPAVTEEEQAAADAAREATTRAAEQATQTTTMPAIQPTGPAGGGAGDGTGGGVPSAGPMSSYEQELVDAIKRAEKRAEQDKWLALAQAGLALMASKQPTLGGAIGEAGLVGVGALRSSRDEAEAQRMKLLEAQYGAQMARQKMALATRGGGGGGGAYGGFRNLDQAFDNLMKTSTWLGDQLEGMTDMQGRPIPAMMDQYEARAAQKAEVDRQITGIFGLMSGGAPQGPVFTPKQP